MADGRSKKVARSLRARRGSERSLAVAGFALRCQAADVRGRVGLSHLHATPEGSGSEREEGLRRGTEEPGQEHHTRRRHHPRRSHGRLDDRRRSHRVLGLRSLRGALPRAVPSRGSGGGARWARGAQDAEGQGARRGEGRGCCVLAVLLARHEPHRGGLQQDQAPRAQSRRTSARGAGRGDSPSPSGRHTRRCGRLVRSRRLSATGSTLMSTAVRVHRRRVQDGVQEPRALLIEVFVLVDKGWVAGPYIIRGMTTIAWEQAGEFEDIKYEKAEGIAKITINRPEVRNAFRPLTVVEMQRALEDAREDNETGVIILTGEGPDAFCSGGDQKVRGDAGYLEDPDDPRRTPGGASVGRFHVTDLHVQIRRCPKPVVAMVAGYAVGGGHVLHVICDLTIAADNARFGQVGPKVGSFDGGFGASVLTSLVGPKKAKEMWFLCRMYTAEEALKMGLVNEVVPLAELEAETVRWCREMLERSPFALRLLKASFHAHEDGFAGIQQLAHDANLLFYGSEEAQEGRDAYREKRKPDFSQFPHRP